MACSVFAALPGGRGTIRLAGVRTGLDVAEAVCAREGIPVGQQHLTAGGRPLPLTAALADVGIGDDGSVDVLLRLCGGKGGFGSLLRHATTQVGARRVRNFDAMRDLYGRRMRHVNTEKRLREAEEWRTKEEEKRDDRKRKQREKDAERLALDVKRHQGITQALREQAADSVEAVLKSNPEVRRLLN